MTRVADRVPMPRAGQVVGPWRFTGEPVEGGVGRYAAAICVTCGTSGEIRVSKVPSLRTAVCRHRKPLAVGDVVGPHEVIERVPFVGKHRQVRLRCRVCGNEKVTAEGALRSGTSRRCRRCDRAKGVGRWQYAGPRRAQGVGA